MQAGDSPRTGRGFQAPPKVRAAWRAGNPARAPKRGSAAGKSGENFCFFFFLALKLPAPPPRALLPALAPTWGAPARRPALSPPPANRGACFSRLCFSSNRKRRRSTGATPLLYSL